MICQWLGFN
ncbi:hypothetical protein YPPY95_2258, partial [Yersinia pestis PY-95]